MHLGLNTTKLIICVTTYFDSMSSNPTANPESQPNHNQRINWTFIKLEHARFVPYYVAFQDLLVRYAATNHIARDNHQGISISQYGGPVRENVYRRCIRNYHMVMMLKKFTGKSHKGGCRPKPPLAIPPHSKLWDFLAFSREILSNRSLLANVSPIPSCE